MEKITVHFILNNKSISAECESGTTLLQYLRGAACLKGTKEACGTGHCGVCCVPIDEKPARSCVTLMSRMEGHSIETIEGIAENGEMSVVQRSFLDAGAVQCGFCTPGMVIVATALLRSNLSPTEEDICEGLKHNYCRCTGYVKIIEAVKLAAARLRGENITINMMYGRMKTRRFLSGMKLSRKPMSLQKSCRFPRTIRFPHLKAAG